MSCSVRFFVVSAAYEKALVPSGESTVTLALKKRGEKLDFNVNGMKIILILIPECNLCIWHHHGIIYFFYVVSFFILMYLISNIGFRCKTQLLVLLQNKYHIKSRGHHGGVFLNILADVFFEDHTFVKWRQQYETVISSCNILFIVHLFGYSLKKMRVNQAARG